MTWSQFACSVRSAACNLVAWKVFFTRHHLIEIQSVFEHVEAMPALECSRMDWLIKDIKILKKYKNEADCVKCCVMVERAFYNGINSM